jgi:hypothetical protein
MGLRLADSKNDCRFNHAALVVIDDALGALASGSALKVRSASSSGHSPLTGNPEA